ncbi:MAG: 50S ribosomal protein L17 [Bacteroidota bacterium]
MRHGKKVNHLGRKSAHRKALMKNLAIALITNKRITTTLAKAKALRRYIEPLVTKTKTNTTHSRRVAFSYLQNKEAIKELFGPIAEKVANRPGGYVRIIKIGFRKSDAAEMAMIEFVDFNEVYTVKKRTSDGGESTKKKRTRRGRRKSSAEGATAAAAAETATTETENEATEKQEDASNEEE